MAHGELYGSDRLIGHVVTPSPSREIELWELAATRAGLQPFFGDNKHLPFERAGFLNGALSDVCESWCSHQGCAQLRIQRELQGRPFDLVVSWRQQGLRVALNALE
jgi:hypothetical protein